MTTKHCWQCGAPQMADLEADKRARWWRARVRLYDLSKDGNEPQADSDPELSPELPGTLICAGLRGVADAVIQLATAFHGGPCIGLDMDTLDARIPGLRPTLSRRGGNAVWRIPYDTTQSFDPVRHQQKPTWMARVTLERIKDPAKATAPKPTGFRRGDT